jgi:hypothetical protein
MRPTTLLALLFFFSITLIAQAAPAPDEVETAKSKLAALKGKLPGMLKECLGDEKVWPVKFKGRVSSMRLISPNEAKLTIRLEYVPPETTDTTAPDAGGGGRGVGGGPRSLATTNQAVFIYLRFFDGVWTTYQAAGTSAPLLQNGINHLMASIDELTDQEAGK